MNIEEIVEVNFIEANNGGYMVDFSLNKSVLSPHNMQISDAATDLIMKDVSGTVGYFLENANVLLNIKMSERLVRSIIVKHLNNLIEQGKLHIVDNNLIIDKEFFLLKTLNVG